MKMHLLRFRWWLWNRCYDWDMNTPRLIGDLLVWFADTFCNLTTEEMNLLDIEDGITTHEYWRK